MYTGDWWWNLQIKHFFIPMIIPILVSSDKTVMSLSHGDETLLPAYITINNLDS